MSYNNPMLRKDTVWLKGEIKTPPFSAKARSEAGRLIGLLQEGQSLPMPHSRPMPAIGRRCHELRIMDENVTWRIFYRVDAEVVCAWRPFEKDPKNAG
jgi:phage-related protein